MLKRLFMCLGDSNTGKSTITKKHFNLRLVNMLEHSTQNALIYTSKVLTKGKLNDNSMKKVSSVGDSLVGRTHGYEETSFTLNFIAIFFANDITEITPVDNALQNRLRVIPYTKVYNDENLDETQLPKDSSIKKEFLTTKSKQTFVRIMLDCLINFRLNGEINEPDAALSARSEWVSLGSNVIQIFLESHNITNYENDNVKYSDIKEWVRRHVKEKM